MTSYVIGIDFGTESGRVLLVNLSSGEIAATHVTKYGHGVMSERLPDGSPLPNDWALEHPMDYLQVLKNSIPEVLAVSGADPEQVIGIGVDFTACTVLPTLQDGTPLCTLEKWTNHSNAYVKLWKHHAAKPYADRMTNVALENGEAFLDQYGGRISSEWLFPKIYQTAKEDPDLFLAANRYIEAGDWVVWQLTGKEVRNACAAGYKALWSAKKGYPNRAYLNKVDSKLADIVGNKVPSEVYPVGSIAGNLTAKWAQELGLRPGTPVAVATIDAHASVPAVGAYKPGQMVIAMGTSFCHMLLASEEKAVPGIAGVVKDGILPGLVGYEAGQPAVGDMFAWYVRNFVPGRLEQEAQENGESIHQLLMNRAARMKAGETGLLALDWMNGNRSILMNQGLSGLLVGLTLHSKPEEIYRALLESASFGTRIIIDKFESNGIKVNEIYACGGVAVKNPLFMQIMADVVKKPIHVSSVEHGPAIGAAIFASVAAGTKLGGFDSIEDAIKKMSRKPDISYVPNSDSAAIYDEMFGDYRTIHDLFGREEAKIMSHLREIRLKVMKHETM